MDGLTIVSHPLVQHKLTILRDRTSSILLFRTVVREIATLLCYEVTRDLPTEPVRIETPVATTDSPAIAGKKLVVAPILRAGLAMAEGMLDRLKEAGVTDMRFACLLAARPGAEALRAAHPDVPIWAAAMDEELNSHGYIVPGLGDAGDRTYGTR
jgi:uracil phosphoribosyltransferase